MFCTKFAPFPWKMGRAAVVDALKASLDRMGVESVDAYMIHWPGVWQNEQYYQGMQNEQYYVHFTKAVYHIVCSILFVAAHSDAANIMLQTIYYKRYATSALHQVRAVPMGRQSVVDALKASLDRLGAESVDAYMIYWPGVWQNE
jgi:diketogulonate reductase-like aldo/keto reductase